MPTAFLDANIFPHVWLTDVLLTFADFDFQEESGSHSGTKTESSCDNRNADVRQSHSRLIWVRTAATQ